MKILASGDLHWQEDVRFEECAAVHAFMVDVARAEGVDLFICPGDVYERASTPREREAVSAWITDMAEACTMLFAKGNHDRELDLALMRKLKTAHPIIVEERAGVHFVAGAAVGLVAWPERGWLAGSNPEMSMAQLDALAQDALRNLLRGIGHQISEHNGPRIVAGHFMVDGSETSVGQPLIGKSMNVALSDLALADVPLVLMSHIHKPQAWSFGGCEIVYTGSPYRTSFGETEEKSIVLAEFDGAELVSWKRIPTPCAGMFLFEDEWGLDEETGTMGWLVGWHGAPSASEYQGAEIRLRFRFAADQRDAAIAAAERVKAEMLGRGAAVVKLDPRTKPNGTARAPEVAAATTTTGKLRAYWAARGTTPEAAREKRLMAKVEQLEEALT